MKSCSIALHLSVVLVLGSRSLAADLTKVDRTISKEPAYASKQPKYCLLVFGREAKTRVWLVVDGDYLYVDRNGSGDLTEPNKRVRFSEFKVPSWVAFAEERDVDAGEVLDGKLKHERLHLRQGWVKKDLVTADGWEEEIRPLAGKGRSVLITLISLNLEVRPRPGDPIPIAGRVRQSAGGDPEGCLVFGDSPQTAPVVHFGGPLQMALLAPQSLVIGPEPSDLRTVVGTPGLGKGTFASIDYAGLIADESKPTADIEFPAAETGGHPLKAHVTLEHRC
jgi:hypothetical protein